VDNGRARKAGSNLPHATYMPLYVKSLRMWPLVIIEIKQIAKNIGARLKDHMQENGAELPQEMRVFGMVPDVETTRVESVDPRGCIFRVVDEQYVVDYHSDESRAIEHQTAVEELFPQTAFFGTEPAGGETGGEDTQL
jgi:hypothetical protein